MKINQAEQIVGITKKNIRFYEEQGLLHPSRNLENGYRDYSEQDVAVLYQIKLLRKLSVPIEEIRSLLENRLTLSDCLNRHLIYLAHEEKNLSYMKNICSDIVSSNATLASLEVDQYLLKMQTLEKGGAHFMNIHKNDVKKKQGTTIAACVMISIMLLLIILLLWAQITDPIPVGIIIFYLAFPTAVIIGVLLALHQRFLEIEGGEENEAAKY